MTKIAPQTDFQTTLFTMIESAPAAAKKIKKPKIHPGTHLDHVYETLKNGLKIFFDKHNFKQAVIGVSGGVDSALTLKIAVDALGAENVTALIMPEIGLTSQKNIDHAKILCEFLGVTIHYQPVNPLLADFSHLQWEQNRTAQMNLKARIRAVLLYNFANSHNALVLGTSNKSELLLGYGTKYGDLAADIEVIANLLKTEVIKLADHVGLPPEIVYKTPTAELAAGQTDEGELGATYKELDQVLEKLDLGIEGCIARGMSAGLVNMVFKRVRENKHKTEMPFVIKL